MSKYNLGEKLKEIRRNMKLNQDEFAEKIGVGSRSAYQRLESGENSLTLEEVKTIADKLGITVPEIVPELLSFTNKQEKGHIGVMIVGHQTTYYSSKDDSSAELIHEIELLKQQLKFSEEKINALEDQVAFLKELLSK